MKQVELNKIIELHEKFLNNEEGGVRANLSGVNLKFASLKLANLEGADLSNANLKFANLTGANLSEADLRGANLLYVRLSRANLEGANLQGVNLSKPIILMPYHKHPLQFNFNIKELRIGCQVHSFEYWLEKGEATGNEWEYPKEDQEKLRELITTIIKVYS